MSYNIEDVVALLYKLQITGDEFSLLTTLRRNVLSDYAISAKSQYIFRYRAASNNKYLNTNQISFDEAIEIVKKYWDDRFPIDYTKREEV